MAPLGIPSMSLVTTGILRPQRPEPLSTAGTLRQPEALCLMTGPESPDVLFGVVKLVLFRQSVSDNCFKQVTRNDGRARVADSAHGHTRQTAPAWADVGLVELYPSAVSLQPDLGIAQARQSAYFGQHCLPGQAASDPQCTDVGNDPVHAPSWTRPRGPWVRAPQATVEH